MNAITRQDLFPDVGLPTFQIRDGDLRLSIHCRPLVDEFCLPSFYGQPGYTGFHTKRDFGNARCLRGIGTCILPLSGIYACLNDIEESCLIVQRCASPPIHVIDPNQPRELLLRYMENEFGPLVYGDPTDEDSSEVKLEHWPGTGRWLP